LRGGHRADAGHGDRVGELARRVLLRFAVVVGEEREEHVAVAAAVIRRGVELGRRLEEIGRPFVI
jgi:hypothetical protein